MDKTNDLAEIEEVKEETGIDLKVPNWRFDFEDHAQPLMAHYGFEMENWDYSYDERAVYRFLDILNLIFGDVRYEEVEDSIYMDS